jgi:ABC-type Mn2+/Zn2+ transport system ATPase subunit
VHEGLEPTLQTRALGVRYGSRPALDSVDLCVEPGEMVALVGPNGAGKSSLLHAVVGLIPFSGEIVVHGRTARRRHDRAGVAFVAQRLAAEPDFPITAEQVVMAGRRRFRGLLGTRRDTDRATVARALHRVGLDGLGRRGLGELSGGQLQRVLLARAIAQEADLILLDEPLTGVDRPSAELILDLLGGLARDGAAVVVSTHDLDLVRRVFPRCVALAGRVVGDGPPHAVLAPEGLEVFFTGTRVPERVA